METIRRLRRKYRRIHPVNTVFVWQGVNDYRLAVITKEGRNILFRRIIPLLAILGGVLGITYRSALWFSGFAEGREILDLIEPFYYLAGFYLLAMTGLMLGATLLILSISREEERDELIRSLPLTLRDFSLYKGFTCLVKSIMRTFLTGFLLLFFAKMVWGLDLAHLLSMGLLILLMSLSLCTLGNLLMSLMAICIPPRLRQRVVVGSAIFIAILQVAVAFYFAYVWVGDIAPAQDMIIESLYLMEEQAWLAKESLMRLIWPLIGLALGGGIALRQVWPLVYRLDKGPKEGYVVGASVPVRWETRFVSLIGRLPLDHLTKSFLKRDLILHFRNRSALAAAIVMIGVVLAAALTPRVVPVEFLFLLYFISMCIMTSFLNSSLEAEGTNMDYIKMLLGKGRFITAKIASTFLVSMALGLAFVFWGFAVAPGLGWDFGIVVVRILILSLALLQASLLGMVFGEQILISGKQSTDQMIAYFCVALLMASGWVGIDLFLTAPQMLPGWAGALLPHIPLIIQGGIIAYCIYRLRKFATVIEDV